MRITYIDEDGRSLRPARTLRPCLRTKTSGSPEAFASANRAFAASRDDRERSSISPAGSIRSICVAMDPALLVSAFVRITVLHPPGRHLRDRRALTVASVDQEDPRALLGRVDFSSDKLQNYQELSPFLHDQASGRPAVQQFKRERKAAHRLHLRTHERGAVSSTMNAPALDQPRPRVFRVDGDFEGATSSR